ncbi:RNA polymerase sigma factor [Echinicola vietnamensis]|uniref:RNA polymerase sigma factor, sigma-70 family n=1 Tax=Echinicola vietnamensis (strain DSM 17526 / LMG 23754 / KMM 6221) TaxID=926556 RepID=L0FYN7_ECHVK|nr:sigma-70 family RNA polymerase sigma factor [Echinicola vietnamensis]AGA78412.1 RNA polymerase sigma factor, sigma-70 family [Echinicola vietnamensis DSM 17526]
MIAKPRSLEEVWTAFLDGEDEALGYIYAENIDRLYNYGRQFTPQKSLVKDTIQDVFCQLIDDRKKLGKARSVRAYLMACLRRRLLEALKNERRNRDYEVNDEAFFIAVDANSYFIDSNLSLDQKKVLEKYCNELPVRQREIIMMRFFENMPYEEIAEVMGLANAKTVRTMMYRGLNKLSDSLTPYKSQLLQLLIMMEMLE